MQPEATRRTIGITEHPMRWAVAAWVVVLLIVSIRVVVQPHFHSCYPIFANAARHWCQGADLYSKASPGPGELDCYRYSPLAAALLTPVAALPDGVGGIGWRCLNAGALLAALAWCYRAVLSHPLSRGQQALLVFLVLPLAVGNINNGQANLLVLGLAMASVA